jgi:transposase
MKNVGGYTMLNIIGLKTHPQISLPLDIAEVSVTSAHLNEEGDYIITIESMQPYIICQHCGRKLTKFHGHGRQIELRHLSILGYRTYIHHRPKQAKCAHCDDKLTTQKSDWYETKSPHTKAYDRHLMLQLIGSTVEDVSRKEEVGYDAVEGAIKRCLEASVNWDEFEELKVIGIDEIALTKGRQDYIAIITTQQADGHVAILTVLPDRKKETVREFLDSIPKRLRQTMETSCTDMWEGYTNAVKEFSADHADVSIEVVVDRYHAAKNYRECVDKVRKQECRRLKKILSQPQYDEIVKGMMWIIRKNNRDLTPGERKRLRRLFEYSPKLKLAYTFREELTAIFELQLTKQNAKKRLLKWAAKVRRSTLTCFDKFLTTLNNWLNEIANYFVNRLSSGFVEGLNNKIKTIKRRCYGILRVATIFQRLYLDIEGYRRFA